MSGGRLMTVEAFLAMLKRQKAELLEKKKGLAEYCAENPSDEKAKTKLVRLNEQLGYCLKTIEAQERIQKMINREEE